LPDGDHNRDNPEPCGTPMSSKYPRETARRPRYRLVAGARIQAQVERSTKHSPSLVPVELVDLSRNGCRVKTPVPLEAREPVTVQLWAEPSASKMTLRAIVRWQRPAGNGAWLVGCLADCPIDWDALGELFLSGILSTDEPQQA
jgi:hypothetical protein